MIDKLALFCCKHNLNAIMFWPFAIFIVLVLLFAMKFIATGFHPSLQLFKFFCIFISGGIFVLVSLPFLHNALVKRGEKLPEVILEKARAIEKEGLENSDIQLWLKKCIIEAQNGNSGPLLKTFRTIKAIKDTEKLISAKKRHLEQLNTEILFAESEEIARDAISSADRFCL
jgi:hypothetical protein